MLHCKEFGVNLPARDNHTCYLFDLLTREPEAYPTMTGDLEKQDDIAKGARKDEAKETSTEPIVEPLTSEEAEALARLERLKTQYGVSFNLVWC